MPRFDNRLLFLVLNTLVFVFVWSCSQPTDIQTTVARSELTLSAERMPIPPNGMIYQLWVISGEVQSNVIAPEDAVSIARFSIANSDTLTGFLDESDNLRDSLFEMSGDLFEFDNIVVSVEPRASSPTSPSNIMLVDRISGQLDIPIRMNFPVSDPLWDAIVRYNMEAVSDDDRAAGDGFGVWFSSYRFVFDTLPDTTGLVVNIIDTVEIIPDIFNGETLNIDSLKAPYPYEIPFDSIRLGSTNVIFDQDTILLGQGSPLIHLNMRFHVDSMADTIPPYERRLFEFLYTVPDSTQTIILDIFTQDQFGLPDLTPFGWKYKGWVVSPQIDTGAGRLTSPEWDINPAGKNWMPGNEGGVLTTGKFALIDQPDDGNPFSIPLMDINGADTTFKHPNYPGEDFLDGAALSTATGGAVTGPVNLMPFAIGNVGTVYISVEPDNALDTTTNFPLLAFIRAFPSNQSAISPGLNTLVSFNMDNFTRSVENDLIGFPEIIVSVERF